MGFWKTACLAVASVVVAFSSGGAPLDQANQLFAQAQTAVADAIAGPQFSDAVFSLERYHTLSGTYDGAGVAGRGIAVRWANARMYCIEGVSQNGSVKFLLGPNGRVTSGRCPYASF
jgi:hypothetical protein